MKIHLNSLIARAIVIIRSEPMSKEKETNYGGKIVWTFYSPAPP